nr:hypothetical protein [Tanacetum cinerariifolium]
TDHGTPVMSDDYHVNISKFSLRNQTFITLVGFAHRRSLPSELFLDYSLPQVTKYRRSSTRIKKNGSVPVYLNVYDLTSMNGCAYWFGLGVYHSVVQVHGVEYAFGSHKNATTGIYEGEPKQCEGFIFTKQIPIGWTNMSLREVRIFMKELAQDYKGTSYNLILEFTNLVNSSSSSPSSSEKSTLASTTIDLKRSFGTRNFIPPSSPFLLDSSSFSF